MTDSLRVVLPTGEVIERKPPVIDWAVPDSPELGALVQRLVSKALDAIHPRPSSGIESQLVWVVHTLLVAGGTPKIDPIRELKWMPLNHAAASPAMTPAGLVKLMMAAGQLTVLNDTLPVLKAFNIQHHATGRPSLWEIAALLEDCDDAFDHPGYDGADLVMAGYLRSVLGQDWPAEAVWPFFWRHLDKAFAFLTRRARDDKIAATFAKALRTFPALPDAVVDKLYDLAFSPRDTDRLVALPLLAEHPDRVRRAVAALRDSHHRVRSAAADWLARIKDPEAVPLLERALSQERTTSVRDAILVALHDLGQPVERLLAPEELNRAAAKAARKPVPTELAWFPWDALPVVRWARTGERVPRETLAWLITETVRRKSPEPPARLRVHCRMFRDDDRRRLGRFLLEAWIAEDLRPLPEHEALEQARSQAIAWHSEMTANLSWYAHSPDFGKTVEQLTADYLAEISRKPVGSAHDSRGLLAVVAACAGPDVVPLVEKYLGDWHWRDEGCEALLTMLAWIDHPLAIQLLLSSTTKLRRRPLQRKARRAAEAAAARRGWTLAELTDRTVPTAGFDERGRLELSYGPRVFTATLTPELTIELRNPEGKTIKSLPSPRSSDDKDQVMAAKKALSTARKELKAIATQQTARLYEAMCAGRTWPVDHWRGYLVDHPVLGHLVRRLVWTATGGEPVRTVTFRPLDDGTLTDAHDAEVTLPDRCRIGLAHHTTIPADDAAAWLAHLADYEVVPLFPQFGREVFRLPPERRGDLAFSEFQGCEIARLELRRRATTLGYVGGTLNGGITYDYRKSFPTLGIAIVVEGEGDYVDEREDQVVTLERVRFKPLTPGQPALALGEVPEVLLSEVYNDLRFMTEGAERA